VAASKRSDGPATKGDRVAARELNSGAIHLLRAMGKVDAEAGLTRARLSALSVLVFGGPLPLGRLARIEGVTSPTMTRLVDALVDAGLAVREAHPDSDRMVLVSATPAGRDLMLGAAERRADVIVEAMRGLTPAERRVLREAAPLLERVAAGVLSPPGARTRRPARPR
jgi:DNA-binding MarR family transcriptional regulator